MLQKLPIDAKIMSAQAVAKIIGPRPRDHKAIMCHGHFDLVHPGHIRHLLYAKSKADFLIVGITGDAHITKANYRPFVPQDLRALNLAALQMVDFVVIDENPTPLNNIGIIQPDYYARGFEYSHGDHPGTGREGAVLQTYGGEMLFTPGDVVFSSSRIIETSPPHLAIDKLMALMQAEKLTFADMHGALKRFGDFTVHVVGDTIIDSHSECTVIGGMTKTPTMSVRQDKRHDYVGGAAVVAKHLAAAGAKVHLSTVLGADKLAKFALDDLAAAGVEVAPIVEPARPTTHKNSFMAGGYNLLKVDTLDNRSLGGKALEALVEQVNGTPADVVVFSDFRHGVFSRHTIPVLTKAIPVRALTVADSQVASRWGNILDFKGFDLITPNEREARFALADQDSVVRPLGVELYRRALCRILMLKLGAHGLMTFRTEPQGEDDMRTFFALDSFASHVVDAVGAGDALLAYAALGLAATQHSVIASVLGSLAAAIECGHDGNVPVDRAAVAAKLELMEQSCGL